MFFNKIYLEHLLELRDNLSIKIITGIRGIGKTSLLTQFIDNLKDEGISSEQIIYINFEEELTIFNFQQLYEFVNEKIVYLEQAYLIFDEIHQVKGWEKAINAFFVGSPVDIYIADSNSSVISNDFLSLLGKNYEMIQMQPLKVDEYLTLESKSKDKNRLKKYLKFGGLPNIIEYQNQSELLPKLISGIYHETLNKDIVARYAIRDVSLLDTINKCLAENIGKCITPNVIIDYLNKIGKTTTTYTMENYLQFLDESKLFHRVPRYDLKKQSKVNGSENIYCADLGIRNFLLNFNDCENPALIENLIYLELSKQNYKIFVGKFNKHKINFVALKDDKTVLIQIVDSVNDKSFKQKISILRRIDIPSEKLVVSVESTKMNEFKNIPILDVTTFIKSLY